MSLSAWWSIISQATICVLSFCIALIYLNSQPYFCLYIGITSFSSLFLLTLFGKTRFSYFCLALFSCVLPFFGQGQVTSLLSGFLLGISINSVFAKHYEFKNPPSVLAIALFPIIAIHFLAILNTLMNYFDWAIVSDILRSAGVKALYEYLSINRVSAQQALNEGLGIYLSILLSLAICEESAVNIAIFRTFKKGLMCGFLVSGLIGVCQIIDLGNIFRFNLSPFWLSMARVDGTFTDPNSLAIMGICCLPVFIGELLALLTRSEKNLTEIAFTSIVICLSSFVLAFSGSRTLILAMCLWAIIVLPGYIRRKFGNVLFATATLVFLASISCLVFCSSLNEFLISSIPVSTLQRTLYSLDARHIVHSLISRTIFWRLAFEGFLTHPISGIGLGRFFEEQENLIPLSNSGALEILGTWRDNANNYYLSILCDAGLCGLVLLFLSIYLLFKLYGTSIGMVSSPCYQYDTDYVLRRSLLVLLLVLVTGPHLYFEEVKCVVFAFLGILATRDLCHRDSCLNDTRRVSRFWLFSVCVVACVMFVNILCDYVSSGIKIRGFYPIEHENRAAFRWITANTHFGLRLSSEAGNVLWVRATHPDISENPVTVSLQSEMDAQKKDLTSISISDTQWQMLKFEPSLNKSDTCIPVSMKIDRLWSPSQYSQEMADRRYMGVMLKWSDAICQR